MKKKFISTHMKLLILVLLLLSITFYASGCIVLVKSGYKLSDYADELHINPNNFKYDFNFDGFNFDFNSSYTSKDYTLNSSITEIDFNLSSQDIKVANYDGDDLKVEIKSHNSKSAELPVTESGTKLILNTKYDTPSNASILVNVPNKFKDKGTLKIVTSSGHITISDLSTNTLSLSTASGDISASNSTLTYLNLTSSSGKIKFNTITSTSETKLTSSSGDISGTGSLGSLNGNTSSGDINLELVNSLGNTSLTTNSGSVKLSLPKDSDYKINYETISGDLNSSSKELSHGNESSAINVHTTSGGLTVK